MSYYPVMKYFLFIRYDVWAELFVGMAIIWFGLAFIDPGLHGYSSSKLILQFWSGMMSLLFGSRLKDAIGIYD